MKSFRTLFCALVVLVVGLAFLPLFSPAMAQPFNWQQYASSYQYNVDCYSLNVSIYPQAAGTLEITSSLPPCPWDATKYQSGAFIELKAHPTLPYYWKMWIGTFWAAANPTNFNIYNDVDETAVFSECLSITAVSNPPQGGTIQVSPPPNCPTDPNRYLPRTALTLTAFPNEKYDFLYWNDPTIIELSTNPILETVAWMDNRLTAQFGGKQRTYVPLAQR